MSAGVSDIDSMLRLAREAVRAGRLHEGEALCERVVSARAADPDAMGLLGEIALQRGECQQAVDLLRAAVGQRPEAAHLLSQLGVAYHALGRLADAEAAYARAIQADARHVPAHTNLGRLRLNQGDLDGAIGCQRRALELDPACTSAHVELGIALSEQGRPDEAVRCWREALSTDPTCAEAHSNLGAVWHARAQLDEAVARYRQALEIQPQNAEAQSNLIRALTDQGKLDEAAEACRHMWRHELRHPLCELQIAGLCPPIFSSTLAVDAYRESLLARLERLSDRHVEATPTELLGCVSGPSFFLAYHGRDDRPIRETYARIVGPCFPRARPAVRPGRARIGFVVTDGHEGVFVKVTRGIIERLDPERFEPLIICSSGGSAVIWPAITNEAVRLLALPDDLEGIVATIRQAHCDVLFHYEVGTDPLNYFLPFFGLAPVQCTSWGAPVTSGIAQMDYYLSSEQVEPHGADVHYTETLVRLHTLPAYYFRPPEPAARKTREDLGLRADRHIYLCPQNLLKLHPDLDATLAGILRRDPNGEVVLIEGQRPQWAALLRRRFDETIADCVDRIRFLPRQNLADFLGLLALCDVMLDPFHFGGAITTLDALSFGTPIVTWPGAYARGRVTYACYRKMGVQDCIAANAEDYVRLAVQLGTDRAFREWIRSRILDANDVLFEDIEAVRGFERFLQHALDARLASPHSRA